MSADDFLQRERDILGADADLFGASSASTSTAPGGAFDLPTTDFPELGDGEAPVPNVPARSVSSAAAADAGFPSIDALDRDDDDRRPPAAPQVNITGVTAPDDDDDGELDKFQAEYPDVDELLPAELKTIPVASNYTYGSSPYSPQPPAAATSPQPSPAAGAGAASSSSAAAATTEPPESEAIVAWRARQAEAIATRDAKSRAEREARIAQAEKDIDGFYDRYNQGKERAIKENKESEAAFLASLEAQLGEGTTWDRICTLVGLEHSQAKTLARPAGATTTAAAGGGGGGGGSDLARMKEVMLKLRRQGESAPGAAGY